MTALSGAAADAPFVGRERELARLEQCAAEVRNGEPRVVLIEGSAGAGKSALLTRFLLRLPDARVIRASGAESEMPLPYGLITQLITQLVANPEVESRDAPLATADPLVAGADLAVLLGQAHATGRLVALVVDDLHWADPGSAAALLFALRRMHGEAVLAALSARPAEFGLLGDGWSRFASGDHRVSRLRLGGLTVEDARSLAVAAGTRGLSHRAASRLVSHTGGNPGYCRAVLEESDPETWDGPGDALPVPLRPAGTILARLAALTPAARRLADAAAILGGSCSLTMAAALASMSDPVPALGELVAAGLATEQVRGSGNRILFPDLLTSRTIQDAIAPTRRRQLHQQAAALAGPDDALGHRVAAAAGHDAALAAELEVAARVAAAAAAHRDRMAQAATWLAQASALSPEPGTASRLILDALDILLRCGDVAEAEALAPRVADVAAANAVADIGPVPRRTAMLGHLDLLAGRPAHAEALLSDAWQAQAPAREPLTGAHAAVGLLSCSFIAGRLGEAVTWGERAVHAAGPDFLHSQQALCALALALAHSQRGQEALGRLDSIAACAGDVPLRQTDALVARGMVRVVIEDLEAAVTDLSTVAGRLRSGVPVREAPLCLGYLAEAEYRLGSWDDAALHAELAVALAREAGRVADYGRLHSLAALVPAGRGDWAIAEAHVAAAGDSARTVGSGLGIAAWAAARAALAAARGDHDEVLRAADAVRRTGRARVLGSLGIHGWRPLEVDALIAIGNLDDAGKALAEIDASLSASSPASARIAAARLRGGLAGARGDAARSARAFEDAWAHAHGVRLPFQLAQLELADGRRLRTSARRPDAIARLRSARGRLSLLGARPYVSACDQELAACGVQLRRQGSQASHGSQGSEASHTSQGTLGLSTTELAVARLVAAGRSNREAAAELYVSIKGIEFHLSNIFAKLGIRSRRALAECLGEGAGPAEPAVGPVSRSSGAPFRNARLAAPPADQQRLPHV